jgi:hypothetical protein
LLQEDGDRPISRRAALKLGAGAGAVAATAPYLARLGSSHHAVDLSGAVPAMAEIPNWPVPAMVTRAQWGANEALRKPGQVYDTTIQKLIVHHTASPNSITNYAGICRGILADETSGEYIDIAYNWLIDPVGRIYEGRWAQNYAPGGAHTGEKALANVRGAHALNHNSRTIGVALIGTYDTVTPPPAMVNSLVALLAWKCARWGIDPLGHGLYTASNGYVHDLENICGHRDTFATDCPGQRTEPMLPSIRSKVAGRLNGAGYWIASGWGQVVPFGAAGAEGDMHGRTMTAPIAGIAGDPQGVGYWLFGEDGNVYPFGSVKSYGSTAGRRLNAPMVGMAPTPTAKGYWLVGRDGGIFTFGDAKYFGSTGGLRLNAPVLGMTPTQSGHGYYLYARDGGIFSFGDAKFHGSTGNLKLVSPVVAMAERPQGDGYWLAAGDGGVFTFGQAGFHGSWAGASKFPCVGMLPSTSGRGYVLLRRDGSVKSFGDAPNLGGAVGKVGDDALGIVGRLKPI